MWDLLILVVKEIQVCPHSIEWYEKYMLKAGA